MTGTDYSLVLALIGAKDIGLTEKDEIRDFLIKALGSGELTSNDLRVIAEMLNPTGRGDYSLKVGRRRGNRNQDDKYNELRDTVEEIYESTGKDISATIDLIALPIERGGLDISDATARKYILRIDPPFDPELRPERKIGAVPSGRRRPRK